MGVFTSGHDCDVLAQWFITFYWLVSPSSHHKFLATPEKHFSSCDLCSHTSAAVNPDAKIFCEKIQLVFLIIKKKKNYSSTNIFVCNFCHSSKNNQGTATQNQTKK